MEEEEGIGEITTKYFQTLFTSSKPDKEALDRILVGVSIRVSEDQNRNLMRPFSKAEVEFALKSMNPTKARARMKHTRCSFRTIGTSLEKKFQRYV